MEKVIVLGDDSTGGNRLSGYIGEILIFDRALSEDDMNVLTNYLRNKWAVISRLILDSFRKKQP